MKLPGNPNWNLPPGVTPSMVDKAMEVEECEECGEALEENRDCNLVCMNENCDDYEIDREAMKADDAYDRWKDDQVMGDL